MATKRKYYLFITGIGIIGPFCHDEIEILKLESKGNGKEYVVFLQIEKGVL